MNALMIRPENLPADPIELSKIAEVGREYIKSCKNKLNAIKSTGNAEKINQCLKESQEAAIKLIEVYRKIGEISCNMKPVERDAEFLRNEKNGKITGMKMNSAPCVPKWQRMGLKNKSQLEFANMIYKNPQIVFEVIQKTLEKDEIPTIAKIWQQYDKSKIYTKKADRSRKENYLSEIKKISSKIKNMSLERDEYFLNKVEKILENTLQEIKDKKMMEELKNTEKTEIEIQKNKRLI